MTEDEVLAEFREADALLEGHFILSSGLHSPVFLQKMLVFQDPQRTERLCRALAEAITAKFGQVDLIVSPAVGGLIPGYETARALGCKAVFVEREEGEFRLRRGFEIPERAGARATQPTGAFRHTAQGDERAGHSFARPETQLRCAIEHGMLIPQVVETEAQPPRHPAPLIVSTRRRGAGANRGLSQRRRL